MTVAQDHTTSPAPVSSHAVPRSQYIATIAGIALAIVLAVLFPGDMSFHDDECSLITNALNANRDGRLASFGLGGTFGYGYGPIPTQFYQVVLLFTHDLRAVVAVRAILFVLVMAGSMWVIARTLRLPPWMMGIFLCAPWVWFYGRLLWDNTFNLPLGFVALAAYVRWLDRPTRLNSAVWAAAAVMMPLVHLSAATVTLAFYVHAMATRFRPMRLSLGWIVLGAAITCSTSTSYIAFTADQLAQAASLRLSGYDTRPATRPAVDWFAKSTRSGRVGSAAFAFYGAQLISGEQQFFSEWRLPPFERAMRILVPVSRLVHIWLFVGAAAAATLIWRWRCDRLRASAALLCCLIIAAQAGCFAIMRINTHAHYNCASAAATLLLCWFGIEWLWQRNRWLRALVLIPAGATAACTVMLLLAIHRMQGGNSTYSPTLSNLISLAEGLRDNVQEIGWTDNGFLAHSPQRLQMVRELHTPEANPGTASTTTGAVIIRFRRQFPHDGWLMLEFPIDPPDSAFGEIRLRR